MKSQLTLTIFEVNRDQKRLLGAALGGSCHRYSNLLRNVYFQCCMRTFNDVNYPPRVFNAAQKASFAIALANGRLKDDPQLPPADLRRPQDNAFLDLLPHEREPVLAHWSSLSRAQQEYISQVGLPFFEQRRHVAACEIATNDTGFELTFVLAVSQGVAIYYTGSSIRWTRCEPADGNANPLTEDQDLNMRRGDAVDLAFPESLGPQHRPAHRGIYVSTVVWDVVRNRGKYVGSYLLVPAASLPPHLSHSPAVLNLRCYHAARFPRAVRPHQWLAITKAPPLAGPICAGTLWPPTGHPPARRRHIDVVLAVLHWLTSNGYGGAFAGRPAFPPSVHCCSSINIYWRTSSCPSCTV